MAVFICQAADDPVPAEAGMVLVSVHGGAGAFLLEKTPGLLPDLVLGQEEGYAAVPGLVFHVAERIALGPADGIAQGLVADLLRAGAHELLQPVEKQMPLIVDAFVQDIQVPAFRPGGFVDHDGACRHGAGNREREAFLSGKLLRLRQDGGVPEEKDAPGPVLTVQVHLPHGEAQLFG